MPTYDFQLDSVLKVRRTERDAIRGRVAEASRAIQELDKQIASLRGELQELQAGATKAVGQSILDVSEIAALCQAESSLRRELRQLDDRRRQSVLAAERCQEELRRADSRVRSLERLRERRQAEYRRKLQRRENRDRHEFLAARG